jgi:serine O-acetyltransferase
MFKKMIEDVKTVFERDPAAKGYFEVLFCYPGLKAVWMHRIASFLWRKKIRFFSRLLSQINRFFTGIEIHPGAKIGVVIGGVSSEKVKRHATVGDEVVIGAGSIILGPITIGECAKIGANSVVLKNVNPCTTVVGIPAREAGKHIVRDHIPDLDHQKIADPVKNVLDAFKLKIDRLEKEIADLKKNSGPA